MAKGVIISARVSRKLAAAVRRWAYRRNQTRSRFILHALEAEVRRWEAMELEPKGDAADV